MKRQRSYGDGLNEDRRRFYDRGPPPPPPPPRRPPPREYDGDRFDRGRKGFGGGGFHEGRHREHPSPREYGGERTMHRSESFSGFRREFPKGFRSERDRSRRDGDGSSAWRRSGSGWRDAECFDEYRAPTTTRMGAASLTAQPQRSRSRSPSEPRRRFEVSKAEKLKKQTACVSEMEEGEVAPDGEPKARPAAVENRKLVEPSRAREKGLERGKVKKLDSEAPTDLGAQCKGATGAADPYNAGKEEGRRIDGPPAEAGKPIDQGSGKSLLKVEEEVGVGEEVQAQDVVTGDGMLAEAGKPIDQGSEKYLSKVEEEVGVGEEVQAQDVVIGDGMLAEAGKPIDQGSEMHLLKVEEEVGGGDEVQAQDVVTGDASKFGLSTSPMQQEVLQEEVNQQKETANSVDFVGQSTSSSILKEVIQEGATTREEIFNGINDARNSSPSSFSQGAMQDEVMLAHKTDSAAADVGKSTSSIMRQEMLQEEALSLDSTAYAVDKVGKSAAPGMLQEVLREEVMQHDGTANAVDRIETGTSSDLLHEAPQEKMTILDETAHNIDTLEPTSYSCMLKEAMREGELTMDGTANTTGVAGQSNSSDMMGEAMHEKTAVLEGTVNIVNTTGESDTPTGLQREVIASLLTAEESEKITVTGEKDKSTEYVALQTEEEVPLEMNLCEKGGASEETMIGEKEVAVLHENVEKQVKEIDIEAKADGSHLFPRSTKKHAGNSKEDDARGNLMTRESMAEDRGNGIAFDVLSKKVEVEHSSLVGRDLDSAVQLGMEPTETSKSAPIASVKQENDTIKIGKLDLSLSLSGCLQNSEFKCSVPKTASLVHAACSQSLPSSSFHTNSYGFTASMTSSQTLGQNPICSLTQQSLDNHDHSVGSKPFFVGVDQMSNCTGRQVQLSSESTQKGSAPLLQRVLQNGHMADTNTLSGIKRHNNGISNGLRSHTNIPIVLSPTHSSGSHNSGLEHSRHIKQLKREKSSSSLTSGGRQEGEQIVINGAGVIERIISKVISEPLHLTVRMLQEMTENSITFLRKAISEIIVDPDRRVQIIALQEALKKRSDLNSDTLRTCPRVLMEILVAIKTGLPYFIKKSSSVATSNLVDIFLNLKCRNLSCQSILPVDDCDCKVCQRKTGFCSSCMCIVCSKFDSASNTCSWVGCDVCLHWCHTDCGLRQSLIRKGQSASRTYGTTEMQFHCTACGHPSKMFGFVKEVFQTCVRQWRMETLIKELQYVERIFSGSDDVRGKRVRDFVKRMLIESQNRANHPEVVKCVVAFFSDDDANLGINPSVPLKGIPCSIDEPIYGIPSSSRKAAWAPFTLEGLPVLDKTAVLSTTGSPSVHRKSGEAEFHTISNKPAIDELDSLIRLKQAEAYMYQERANDARNEVDHLRHIIMVKNARIEEDYATQIADLDLNELQERRKRQIEELLVIERTHHEFASMKTRMVASTRELLAKMDALKQNRST